MTLPVAHDVLVEDRLPLADKFLNISEVVIVKDQEGIFPGRAESGALLSEWFFGQAHFS